MTASGLGHPAMRAVSGATGVAASGVSVGQVTNTLGGIVVAIVALVTLFIGINRNNRNNKLRAKSERRRAYRRGWLARDRELAQIVSDAAYWRGYALEHRKPNAPPANPPIVVSTTVPDDVGDDVDEGDEDE